ncbi:MAG: YjcZ family sporulation protein [Bacilli bacterium]|nr:YjcZ family sporulation protein [Bacilli bacterium]MDD4076461.1 YjcZ family sporulation protein [Bacilli bacterium]MDD4388256.1 YjcZ family sporulation protein [Bacilli bacterium]
MPGRINPCKQFDPCCTPAVGVCGFPGFAGNRYAFVLVLFILLVIVGAAFWF